MDCPKFCGGQNSEVIPINVVNVWFKHEMGHWNKCQNCLINKQHFKVESTEFEK